MRYLLGRLACLLGAHSWYTVRIGMVRNLPSRSALGRLERCRRCHLSRTI